MILQSLAFYALNTHNYKEAEDLFLQYAESKRNAGESEAVAYHRLGMIAQERRDFDAAEKWYRKSLEIEEKHGNEHGMASTYHQLGNITSKRRDFEAAEKWCRKSLKIKEKYGNEHGAEMSYGQLGILAGLQERFEESGKWMIKAILLFSKCNDPAEAQKQANNFMIFYKQAAPKCRQNSKLYCQRS